MITRINSLLHNKVQRARWVDRDNKKLPEPADPQLPRQAQLDAMKNLTEPDFRIADLAKTLAQSQPSLKQCSSQ